MKKLITLAVVMLTMFATVPIKAEENKPFEKDVSVVCEEGQYISVYGQNIREKIGAKLAKCDCKTLCHCTVLEHVLEDTTEDDFYSAFFSGDYFYYPLGEVYQDCSSSMEIFSYENSIIHKNLSSFFYEQEKNIEDIFKNKKTNLYGFLNSFKKKKVMEKEVSNCPEKTPIIITDLWDTEGEEEAFKYYYGQIVFCVPYASTNKEGVLHCEEFVNNLLWNHSYIAGSITVDVVFIDEVVVEYDNCYMNGYEGSIKVYVP